MKRNIVIEISESPIDPEERIDERSLDPDSEFMREIAHQVWFPTYGRREALTYLQDLALDENDSFTVTLEMKENYLKKLYEAFMEYLGRVTKATASLDDFISADNCLDLAMYNLNTAFERRHDRYVYWEGDIVSFDRFMRIASVGKTYYVGGIVEYD